MSKGQESAIPKEDQDFIDEFQGFNKNEFQIREYEQENRKRLEGASLFVKDAFDRKWKEATGSPWMQVITSIAMPEFGKSVSPAAIDPKSRNYRAKVMFSEVFWTKIDRRFSRKDQTLYILDGTEKETGDERPIFRNLRAQRLPQLLGNAVADKIFAAVKKGEESGSVKVDVEVEVQGFWEVVFHPKKDINDTEDVRIEWEGESLRMQRETPLVLPGFYLEVADNAQENRYVQDPKLGQGRKLVGKVARYTYTVRREATRQEYLALKRKGDEMQKRAMEREEAA